MRVLYDIFINLVSWLLPVIGIFSRKVKAFLVGRQAQKGSIRKFREQFPDQHLYCFHCASLGEFEMIVPLLKRLRMSGEAKLVATFFSPSGYDQRKNSPHIDAAFYLPLDTKHDMRNFVRELRPDRFFFVKYDLWYNLIDILHKNGTRIFLVNGMFKADHFLHRSWARSFLASLDHFEHFFLQNQGSQEFLTYNGMPEDKITITGDMRYDRVSALEAEQLERIDKFCEHEFLIVGGSTWQPEEELLAQIMEELPTTVKLVLVPHDVSDEHIAQIMDRFESFGVSRWSDESSDTGSVLVVDTIGILMRVYQSADIAIIGGGFTGDLHNILEPLSAGLPVICGPKTDKFPEAQFMLKKGLVSQVNDSGEMLRDIMHFVNDRGALDESRILAKATIAEMAGGTQMVMNHLDQ